MMMSDSQNTFTLEWLVAELIIQAILYKLIIMDVVTPYFTKQFATFDCFDTVKKRSGTLLKNMADEVPGTFAVGLDHLLGLVLLLSYFCFVCQK